MIYVILVIIHVILCVGAIFNAKWVKTKQVKDLRHLSLWRVWYYFLIPVIGPLLIVLAINAYYLLNNEFQNKN